MITCSGFRFGLGVTLGSSGTVASEEPFWVSSLEVIGTHLLIQLFRLGLKVHEDVVYGVDGNLPARAGRLITDHGRRNAFELVRLPHELLFQVPGQLQHNRPSVR
jgi:hypothetical protein